MRVMLNVSLPSVKGGTYLGKFVGEVEASNQLAIKLCKLGVDARISTVLIEPSNTQTFRHFQKYVYELAEKQEPEVEEELRGLLVMFMESI